MLIFTIIWEINIIPKQISFDNICQSNCLSKGLDYETKIFSYPWNNVNGECYCKKLNYIKIVKGVGFGEI